MARPSRLILSFLPAFIILTVTGFWQARYRPLRQSSHVDSRPGTATRHSEVAQSYGKLPLSFEPNRGQTEQETQFTARGPRQALFLKFSEADLVLAKDRSAGRKKSTASRDLTSLAMLLPEMLRPE